MKRVMIALILLIPISSVVFCITLFWLAQSGSADLLPVPDDVLSKTSWQDDRR